MVDEKCVWGWDENDELRMGIACPRLGLSIREDDQGPPSDEGKKGCVGGDDTKDGLLSDERGG